MTILWQNGLIFLMKKNKIMNIVINAFQIAESLNVKLIKKEFSAIPIYSSSFELFYKIDENKYLYLLDYGVAIFANYEPVGITETLLFLNTYCSNPFDERYTEDFEIITGSPSVTFSFNSLHVPDISADIIRISMLNVGQSVALDYYYDLTQRLLESTTTMTHSLEHAGKFKVSKTKLLKFIGKSMNLKKQIIDNIYILDEPDTIWENELLNKLNYGLKETFDIRSRFRNLDYKIQIIKENLQLFSELFQHKESNRLEWIIIFLILIEVIHLIINLII